MHGMLNRPSAVRILLLLAALSFSWVPTLGEESAPRGTGKIEGRIYASDAKTPAAGALVTAVHLVSGRIFTAAATGADGIYRLSDLPYGYFEFAIDAGGTFYAVDSPLDLRPDGREKVNIKLGPAQAPPPGSEGLDNGIVIAGFDRRATAVAQAVSEEQSGAIKTKYGVVASGAFLALLLLLPH